MKNETQIVKDYLFKNHVNCAEFELIKSIFAMERPQSANIAIDIIDAIMLEIR